MKNDSRKNLLEDRNIGTLELSGNEPTYYPMWAIINFLNETCSIYNKFTIIRKSCELLHTDISTKELFVMEKSADLYPKKLLREFLRVVHNMKFRNNTDKKQTENNLGEVINADKDLASFMHKLLNLDRPIVFYAREFYNDYPLIPLLDFNYKDLVKIT